MDSQSLKAGCVGTVLYEPLIMGPVCPLTCYQLREMRDGTVALMPGFEYGAGQAGAPHAQSLIPPSAQLSLSPRYVFWVGDCVCGYGHM